MLYGEKVFLRPIELEDLPIIHKWRNDSEFIYPGLPDPTPFPKLEEWYEELVNSNKKVFLICDGSNDKPFGTVGISSINVQSQNAKLEIIIGEKEYRGQGFEIEAVVLFLDYCFKLLNLRRIAVKVDQDNEEYINSFEKVGFRKEGQLRRSIFKDGRYVDQYVMAIFKDEYFDRYLKE
ncbi:hypothetical protein BBF96_08225 [Anoxybacter fermentans]|uniref:N-acetyltransferase domain-containing protein n=1 Tax=Anoxybacter fermentans TaxID=1323375 RepID=A0A3Q9HQG2_9FIRM|nr:GNAT family protein [Anoxybacter fermentans]AZR73369.1 hypothetical protein BBF96_08225 [Anoxybacter fermentans]